MRVTIMSDLHLEGWGMPRSWRPPDCDIVVLAGDIHKGEHGVLWANEAFSVPVVYVAGNHEFYGRRKIAPTIALMKESAKPHVHVLDGDVASIDGVIIAGATLWTDFRLYGNAVLSGFIAGQGMNDYRLIEREPWGKLRPEDTAALHAKHHSFLANLECAPDIVVTHHAPSEKSVNPKYGESPLNPAYASHCDDLVERLAPQLWAHGHMHDHVDYRIGETRVIANPRGYAIEADTGFEPDLIIEVSIK